MNRFITCSLCVRAERERERPCGCIHGGPRVREVGWEPVYIHFQKHVGVCLREGHMQEPSRTFTSVWESLIRLHYRSCLKVSGSFRSSMSVS